MDFKYIHKKQTSSSEISFLYSDVYYRMEGKGLGSGGETVEWVFLSFFSKLKPQCLALVEVLAHCDR